MNKIDRLYNIDFLRIILVVLIVFYHLLGAGYVQTYNIELYKELLTNTRSIGIICNSIFFMISGYFLYNSLFSEDYTLKDFVIKKILRFWPVLAFSVLICAIFSLFGWIHFDVDGNLLLLCMIHKNGSGLATHLTNFNSSWFVCWLFWLQIFYFGLSKIVKKEFNYNFLIAILVYLSLLIYVNNPGRDYELIYSWIPRGGLLGFIMTGIGILINAINSKIKISINMVLSSIIEISLFGYFIYGFFFGPFRDDFILTIIAVIIFLFFIINKQGCVSNILNNKNLAHLGNFAFSTYIMQEVAFYFFSNCLWKMDKFIYFHPILILIISLIIVLILGVCTYYIVELKAMKIYKAIANREGKED